MKLIFEYSSYRDYLRDFYQQRKTAGRFSYREFSRLAGFSSPNFIKLVIDGATRLSPASIKKICTACELKAKEKACFAQLVKFEQAKTIDDKMTALAEIQNLRSDITINNVAANQKAYYEAWYHAVVREMINILGRADASEIAALIQPSLKIKKIQESIALLKSLGMITGDKKKAALTNTLISSGDSVPAACVKNYQREMGLLGIDALFALAKDEREISGATFCMSEKSAEELKRKIINLRKDALRLAAEDSSPERVFRLNLQLFPVSQKPKSSGSPVHSQRDV